MKYCGVITRLLLESLLDVVSKIQTNASAIDCMYLLSDKAGLCVFNAGVIEDNAGWFSTAEIRKGDS